MARKSGVYLPEEGSIDPNAGPHGGQRRTEGKMTDADLASLVQQLVEESEKARDDQSDGSSGPVGRAMTRQRAQEYYDGKMSDTPASPNRSKVVSRDVRTTIKKLMPSMVRTILGSDSVVEYQPTSQQKEEQAKQASLYVNHVVIPESNVGDAIYDAIHDAALHRNGWVKWWWDDRITVTEAEYSGLDDASFQMLAAPDEVTVLEHTQKQEMIETLVPDPQTGTYIPQPQPVNLHDCRVRIYKKQGRVKVACFPAENMLIHPDALDIETSQLTGTYEKVTRSDLVAMGIDRDKAYGLPIADEHDREMAEQTRRRNIEDGKVYSPGMEEIDYYDLYVRVDFDDDGIAELRRIVMAGGFSEENILSNECWDDCPIADVKIERRPHQIEGHAITDDVADVMQINTVLFRSVLDNLYMQNNMRPVYQEGVVLNPKAFFEAKFGEPVRIRAGSSAADAVNYLEVPFIAKAAFDMLAYMQEVIVDRTGISDASAGLPPDALQNVTAKASSLLEQAGIGQTEMMVKTVAKGGLQRMFKGILKLVTQHQDQPRTVKLTEDWVTFDPRKWDGEMECIVNTGLGAGTRERDMMMVSMVLKEQKELLMSLGAEDNPLVSPDNYFNSLEKLVQATGGRNVNTFFTKPNPEDLEARKKARQENKPKKPEEMMQLEYQLKQQLAEATETIKANADVQKMQATMQKEAAKEQAQLQADLQVKLAEIEKESAIRAQEIEWEREKLHTEQAFQLQLEKMKIDAADKQAEWERQAATTDEYASEFEKEQAEEAKGATKQ